MHVCWITSAHVNVQWRMYRYRRKRHRGGLYKNEVHACSSFLLRGDLCTNRGGGVRIINGQRNLSISTQNNRTYKSLLHHCTCVLLLRYDIFNNQRPTGERHHEKKRVWLGWLLGISQKKVETNQGSLSATWLQRHTFGNIRRLIPTVVGS